MLDRERFRVSVVTLREKGDMAPLLEEKGIPVSLSYMKSRWSPSSLRVLAAYLRSVQADVVHCHMRRANTSGRVAAMMAGVPVRLAHERDQGLGKNWRHYLIDRLLGRCNGPILTVTQGVAEHQSRRMGLPIEKFIVQYNGLELDPFRASFDRASERTRLGLPVEKTLIGCIGRLARVKRIPLLVRAFARLAGERADVDLVIVGEGREGEALRQLVVELSLQDRVHFLPFQSDIHPVYACFDVTAFTSESEGIANVQLESLAAGVPLVSTRVGIAAEAYREGEEYIAVEGDDASIAEGLALALEPTHRAHLIAAGHSRVEGFSLEAQRDAMESLYLRLTVEAGVEGSEA
jgi:glycosyltransferase involved in cell wall biosynthesis